IVEHQHHAARSKAAEIRVALDQADRGAVARRGHRGAETGRAAADHDDIGGGPHPDIPRRVPCECANPLLHHHSPPPPSPRATPVSQRTTHSSIARIARKNNTEKAEPHSTVAYSSAESKL